MKQDEHMELDKYIEITDISLASALLTSGYKIEAYNRDPKYHPRVGFIFRKGRLLEQTIKDYLNGDLVVDPKTFFENIKMLKARTKLHY